VKIPMIGTWKWKKEDYETPLFFPLDRAKGYLYLDPYDPGKRDREIVWDALLQIKFSPVPSKLVKGLTSKSTQAREVADKLYSYYVEVYDKFEAISRTAGNIKNLLSDLRTSYDEFFKEGRFSIERVMWWIDKDTPKAFEPKLIKDRRRINPLFKKEQIITKIKWVKMQSAIENGAYPSEELLELLRIRSKLEWRQRKIATIESAILIETILRDYGEQVLQFLGLSKNKLKSLRDEMSFNTVLNIVLPLSLTKPEHTKVDKHLKSVDLLRRVRNDVVHGNITESEIDETKVRAGIEGALVLVEFLRKKLS
jgi:hypothetical protein